MFRTYTLAHSLNLALHIVAGTLALVIGFVAIVAAKRNRLHGQAGRLFIYAYAVVVITAILGLLIFEFRSFLTVVTILSLYDVFSGYRALQLRGRRPQRLDRVASVMGAIAPWIFIVAMRWLHRPWVPSLTWSILGELLLVSGYDLLRNVLPLLWLRKVWIYEHLYKMMSAYIAITSAFAGTVFVRYMPWSAIAPSILGFAVIAGFFVVGPRAWQFSLRGLSAQVVPASSETHEYRSSVAESSERMT